MCQTLSISRPTARKEHECHACLCLQEVWREVWPELTFSEKKAMITARKNGKKILVGQTYIRAGVVTCDGIQTYKAIIEIDNICQRLKLFDDYC